MLNHVLKCLSAHRIRFQTNPNPTSILDTPKTRVRPLFVGIQGPQGSGKSFLTSHLHQKLSSPPHSLSVVVLSIDDLYLPHVQLVALANANPENKLLRGRGQPGTHDVGLGTIILDRLSRINEGVDPEKANSPSSLDSDNEVRLPVFDKSLHSGEGDRVEGGGKVIRGPIDIVILEGWCLGFQPISASEIDLRWSQPVDGLGPGFFESRGFRKEDIVDVNERLKEYQHWWQFFDTFIQVGESLSSASCLLNKLCATDQTGGDVSLRPHIQVETRTRTRHEGHQWRPRNDRRTSRIVCLLFLRCCCLHIVNLIFAQIY